MQFEFDSAKSEANRIKHGIDFEMGQRLWTDDRLLVASARFDDELRLLAVGRIDDRHWTAIYTLRGSTVRIISIRRACREERVRYEGG